MFCCTEAVKLARAARHGVESHANDAEMLAFYADPDMLRLAAFGSNEVTVKEPENPYSRWLVWAAALNSKAYAYAHQRQKQLLGMANGHSGNTFGCALHLAFVYTEAPEFVVEQHGALTPLVGCEAYGCPHEES
jgi:hypothetical protein